MTFYTSAVDIIGNTPLVKLERLCQDVEGMIYGKIELFNPGFSKKDRIAKEIIEEAERRGDLQLGQTVVELTSGNTGTGLAIVCQIKSYPFVAVMSKGNSPERASMMRALGAEVVLVDQLAGSKVGEVSGGDLEEVNRVATTIVAERKAFRADQFHHEGNFLAHYRHTGPEIWAALNGRVDAFCDFVGTGGTFAGCAAFLKEKNSQIKCYVVEPEGANALAGKKISKTNHKIQGGGYVKEQLAMIKPDLVDGYLSVNDQEAKAMAQKLAQKEGIFAGYSSGANIAGALKLLAGPEKGKNIVCTINDSGLKYLSTDLWG